jgi:hypothetical protein
MTTDNDSRGLWAIAAITAIFAVLLLGLNGSLGAVNPTISQKAVIEIQQTCISVEDDTAIANNHGFTKRNTLEGLEVSRWLDAYARVANVNRADVIKADVLVFSYNPDDPSIVVISVFLNGCLESRVPFPPAAIEQIFQAYQDMRASDGK